jgi:hypothetical protein
MKGKYDLENLDVDGKIILKLILILVAGECILDLSGS